MALSRALQNTLSYFYGGDIGTYFPNYVNISNNNIFLSYLEIKLTQNPIEYPVVLENRVLSILDDNNYYSEDNTLIVPLYVVNSTRRRGKAPILRDILNANHTRRLAKVTTTKGEVYYGNRSMILDKDLNVLMINTIVREEPVAVNRGRLANQGGICNIHPRVFSNKDMISKAIINDIIPYYLQKRDSLGLEIKIRDMDWMVKKSSHPLETGFSNDNINNLIENNADIIVNSL